MHRVRSVLPVAYSAALARYPDDHAIQFLIKGDLASHARAVGSVGGDAIQDIQFILGGLFQMLVLGLYFDTASGAGKLLVAEPIHVGVSVDGSVGDIHEIVARQALQSLLGLQMRDD